MRLCRFCIGLIFLTHSVLLSPSAQAAIVIAPDTPTTVYATIADQELHQSTDGGRTWKNLTPFLGGRQAWRLFLDPRTVTTLYVLSAERELLKSEDRGQHWRRLLHSPAELPLLSVAIDPQTPTHVYVGTNGAGVIKSSDDGLHWSPLSGEIPQGHQSTTPEPHVLAGWNHDPPTAQSHALPQSRVFTLALEPHSPTILYAGTANGIWKSRDGGNQWTTVRSRCRAPSCTTSIGDSPVRHLALTSTPPLTLYASIADDGEGIITSTDGGVHWSSPRRAWPAGYEINLLSTDPTTSTTVYVGVYSKGVFRSTDGGRHWQARNTGLPVYVEARGGTSLYLTALAVDPLTPTTLYAAVWSNAGEGIFKSTNGGATWHFCHLGNPGASSSLIHEQTARTPAHAQ